VVILPFQIVELVPGSISIDGVDISEIRLDGVRNAISIMPQDARVCTLSTGRARGLLALTLFGRAMGQG